MQHRIVLALLVGFAFAAGACTASVGPISETTASSATAQDEAQNPDPEPALTQAPEPTPAAQEPEPATTQVPDPTATEPTADPDPEHTPADDACGAPAVPDSAAVEWEVPATPLSQAEIDALAASDPSTSFNVTSPVVALDATRPSIKYVLGPAWPTEVERVAPTETQFGDCTLTLTLTTNGLDLFNDIAAACFEQTDQCPLGQLAIVSEGQVISAPTVQTPVFDEPSVVISQQDLLTVEQRTAIAEMIANNAQFRPVLAEVSG